MLKNYFTTAYRNLFRYKFYSAIHILGLAVGIACFTFILMFVSDELSYDRFHRKAARIYRVVEKVDLEGQGEEAASNPFPVAPTLQQDYPQLVQATTRFFNFQLSALSLADEKTGIKINEKNLFFTDSTVFALFDFPLVSGLPEQALTAPHSLVLTRSTARKYFGEQDPLGRVLKLEGKFDLTVTGVMEDLPPQSHFRIDGLISFSTLPSMVGPQLQKGWVWNPCWTYVLLQEGVAPEDLEKQFPFFIRKYYPEEIRAQISHYLQPLTDIHLHSQLDYEMQPNGEAGTIYIFGAIGVFILLIACINFMNLATARAAGRAREVGVRKAAGANRGQLIRQFLLESVLLSLGATALAFALMELLLPVFNDLAGKQLQLSLLLRPGLLLTIVLTGLLTGLVAGVYPAFFLSAFEPAKVLKGKVRTHLSHVFLRKGLVVLQFALSLVLIISTGIIYQQLHYLRSADLGFQKEQVVIIPIRPPMVAKYDAFREEVLRHPQVLHVTSMNEVLGGNHNTHEYSYEGMPSSNQWVYFPSLIVNETFTEAFDIPVIAGRGFSREFARDDSLAVIINESMVRHLGWGSPQEALGKRLNTPTGAEQVIGVVQDFNFISLTQPIGPFVLDMPSKKTKTFFTKYVAVRLSGKEQQAALGHLQQTWENLAPQYPFAYFYLEEHLALQYQAQRKLGQLVGYFSVLAILIACLGLYALASFTAEQRTKEIGVRKVMGASAASLVYLLTRDFARLVLIAATVSFPLAWYVMHLWLGNFAYRMAIPWWIFLLAALLGLVVAVLSVGYQALRVAFANPVRSLRHE
jgi:putative ABC transport system permease protein